MRSKLASQFLIYGLFFYVSQLDIHSHYKSEQAKPETVDKVCEIVKKQLALGDDQVVNGESKFSALGADSLDTVSNHFIRSFFLSFFCNITHWYVTMLCMINVCVDVIVQVEIVMGLEEEFGISVEEESAQTIATVQDAADMIEKLCAN